MSRTYRRTMKGKYSTKGKLRALEEKAKRETGAKKHWKWEDWLMYRNSHEYDYLAMSYSSCPSWWNHDYHTVPRRAKERSTIRKIISGYLDPDDAVFPDGKKPVIYYW